MRIITLCITLLLIIILFCQSAFAVDIVRYAKRRTTNFNAAEYEIKSYYLSLLKKALEITTQEYGPYKLQPSHISIRGKRILSSLASGKIIDIKWHSNIKTLGPQLKAIPHSLLRGKSGYKLLMVKTENHARFANINSIEQLRALTAGVSYASFNTTLFKRNSFKVTQYKSHKNVYTMLSAQRFDFYPVEVYGAYLHQPNNPGIKPISHIALHFPEHVYFYVNLENKRLHERVSLGLKKLEDNGEFEAHFKSHPMMAPYQTFDPAKIKYVFKLI